MFIASLICLILGIILLAISVYLFFKLDVRSAFAFIRNKRSGRNAVTSSKQRRRPGLKSSGMAKVDNKRKNKMKSDNKKNSETAKPKSKKKKGSDIKTNVIFDIDSKEGSKALTFDSDGETSILDSESENPTGILDDESEDSTGLLNEESENPTGLLDEGTEKPTSILVEDSENSTELLVEESESSTDILVEDSENPTGILSDESEDPTGILDENKVITKKANIKKKEKKAKTIDSDFKFDVIKEIIVVHTDERIE